MPKTDLSAQGFFNEARSGCGRGQEHKAEANSHEAEAKIALIFFSQILHFDPVFSKKPEIFGRYSVGLSQHVSAMSSFTVALHYRKFQAIPSTEISMTQRASFPLRWTSLETGAPERQAAGDTAGRRKKFPLSPKLVIISPLINTTGYTIFHALSK